LVRLRADAVRARNRGINRRRGPKSEFARSLTGPLKLDSVMSMFADCTVKLLDAAPDGVVTSARRARDRAPARYYIHGLGLAICPLLPISVRGQAVIATRGGGPRVILDRSTMMTKVKTARVARERPEPRAATATNDIRPFQVHMSDSALADLRRRI